MWCITRANYIQWWGIGFPRSIDPDCAARADLSGPVIVREQTLWGQCGRGALNAMQLAAQQALAQQIPRPLP
jgi:hypothetical protein